MGASTPNFLVFVTDQQRFDHLSCAGNPVLRTPHIDALAASGCRFENFYVSIPICMPNRATLFTGRMPSLHGAHCNGAPLRLGANTFTNLLRDAGYRTRLVGKSHIQNMTGKPASREAPQTPDLSPPPDHLAEAWLGMWADGDYEQENTRLWEADPSKSLSLPYYGFDDVDLCTMHGDVVGGAWRGWARERCAEFESLIGPENAAPSEMVTPQAYRTRLPEEIYPTAYVAERTIASLEAFASQREQPFFLVSSFPDPHHPFTPPGRYWDLYSPADVAVPPTLDSGAPGRSPAVAALHQAYASGEAKRQGTMPFAVNEREAREAIALTYGMIAMIDDGIGEVMAALSRLGLRDDTVVIFMSDHGDFMGDHGLMLKAALHYGGLVRVPFIWCEPGLAGVGTSTAALHSTLDIGRSILERAGLAPFWGMQGTSVLPAVADPNAPGAHAVLIEEDGHETGLGFTRPVRVRTAICDGWRLSIYDGVEWGELYDLKRDPHERRNLYAAPEAAGKRAEMFECLSRLMMEHADHSPFPTGRA